MRKFVNALFITAAVFATTSCIKDRTDERRSGDDAQVALTIQLPASSSRALTPEEENQVTAFDVLVFVKDGGEFLYRAQSTGAIISSGENQRFKTFTVTLWAGEYDLVVLANSHDIIAAAGSLSGTKAAVLARLTTEMTTGGKWGADASTSGHRNFPMWGDVGNKLITTSSTDLGTGGGNSIPMTRMMAAVDVTLQAGIQNRFRITQIDVYNYNTQGSLVAASANWDATTNPAAPKALYPTLPSGSSTTQGPITYNAAAGGVIAYTNEIYIFEAENHQAGGHTVPKDLLDRTCIVVGGIYDPTDTGDFSGEVTYYRLDFATAAPTCLDVLRNHRYHFNIAGVANFGAVDSYTAFSSQPVDMTAEVVAWNDGEVGNVIVEGQNYLFIKPSAEYNFRGEAGSQTVNLKTSVSAGWTITKITESDGITPATWITTDKTVGTAYGAGEVDVPVAINVTTNTGDAARTGYIFVTAGRLEARITVNQRAAGQLAAPGVIGYIAEGPRTGELTLRGSKEFAGTLVDINSPFGSGTLENETVYVAYFRWASLVAIGSEPAPSAAFHASNVIWAPKGYLGTATAGDALDAVVTNIGGPEADGPNAWNLIPSRTGSDAQTNTWNLDLNSGLGNPCRFYFDANGRMNPDPYGGYNDFWGLPVGGAVGWNGGTFGTSDINQANWSLASGARWIPLGTEVGIPVDGAVAGDGAGQPDWSMFLPAAGYRGPAGHALIQGIEGGYWSSTAFDDTSGYGLLFGSGSVLPVASSNSAFGFSVRCVRP